MPTAWSVPEAADRVPGGRHGVLWRRLAPREPTANFRYVAVRKRAGWARSDVFERWFRFRQEEGPGGFPRFLLDTNDEKPS